MSIPRNGRRGAHNVGSLTSEVSVKSLLIVLIVFLVATFPATWLLMLFLGNVGVHVGYWGSLPLGILVSVLLGGVAGRAEY